MTFKHKLSCRLALMRDALLLLASAAAIQSRGVLAAGPIEPARQVVVVPESINLDPTQRITQHILFGRTPASESSEEPMSRA